MSRQPITWRRIMLRLSLALVVIFMTSLPAAADSPIAALRRATAPFHRIDVAMSAGWADEITGCLESPEGGMGYHYVNFDLLLDSEVSALQPEALLYEPRSNGKLRLVAVEYVIPDSFLPPDADPPMVLGQALHYSEANHAWILHVWLWRHNPSGMFADWNPQVSCQYAE